MSEEIADWQAKSRLARQNVGGAGKMSVQRTTFCSFLKTNPDLTRHTLTQHALTLQSACATPRPHVCLLFVHPSPFTKLHSHMDERGS